MSRILVTGATGFIGRCCLAPLAARGFDVHAVTIDPPLPIPAVTWHQCNLLDAGETSRLVGALRSTHLLHLAWYAVPGKFWTAPENLDWVSATVSLVGAFARAGGRRFVGAGSCAEYAPSDSDCDERSTPIAPATLYGTCKHAVHSVVEAAAAGRFSAAWGRVFHLYGPQEPPSRLVPSVICSLLEGREAVCTAGTQVRDFMHVQDVADAFAALVASRVEGPVNIASGHPVPLAEVISRIGARIGTPQLIRLGAKPIPPGEAPRLTASVARLRDEVGWSPARDLDRGLAETIAWWRGRAAAR